MMRPSVPHLQSAWLILLLCARPRSNYLLRVLPPAETEAYEEKKESRMTTPSRNASSTCLVTWISPVTRASSQPGVRSSPCGSGGSGSDWPRLASRRTGRPGPTQCRFCDNSRNAPRKALPASPDVCCRLARQWWKISAVNSSHSGSRCDEQHVAAMPHMCTALNLDLARIPFCTDFLLGLAWRSISPHKSAVADQLALVRCASLLMFTSSTACPRVLDNGQKLSTPQCEQSPQMLYRSKRFWAGPFPFLPRIPRMRKTRKTPQADAVVHPTLFARPLDSSTAVPLSSKAVCESINDHYPDRISVANFHFQVMARLRQICKPKSLL